MENPPMVRSSQGAPEMLAKILHELAPGTEFNETPIRYFSLDVGKQLPKNAVTIRKSGNHVTFFVQHNDLLSEAQDAKITLKLVKRNGKRSNEDKYVCKNLDLDKIQSPVVSKLLRESIEITQGRQPKAKTRRIKK